MKECNVSINIITEVKGYDMIRSYKYYKDVDEETHDGATRKAVEEFLKEIGKNLKKEEETPEIKTKSISCFECVLVKAGTIDGECGKKITVEKDFWCAIYPVTEGRWAYHSDGNGSISRLPKVDVDWNEATEFAKKVGGRLLTEAEWEFAARGGIYTHGYEYSGSDNLDEAGWFRDNSNNQRHIVGKKKPNELGIYDMSGNVWEWTNSTLCDEDDFSNCVFYVYRGGSWYSDSQNCRVVHRYYNSPSARSGVLGLRVAFDVKEKE